MLRIIKTTSKMTSNLKIQKAVAKESKGIFLVQDGLSLLQYPAYTKKLQQLKQLISITDMDYQMQYSYLLSCFAEYIQRLPHPVHPDYDHVGGFLEYTLDILIASLKFRRGYMLPLGSDTETCYREETQWTYGIFLAALLQDCWIIPAYFRVSLYQGDRFIRIWDALAGKTMPSDSALTYRFIQNTEVEHISQLKPSNAFIIKSLLPIERTTELYQFPSVFKAWFSHVNRHCDKGNEKNPISLIIQQAENALKNSTPFSSSLQKTVSNLFDSVSAVSPNTAITKENNNTDNDYLSADSARLNNEKHEKHEGQEQQWNKQSQPQQKEQEEQKKQITEEKSQDGFLPANLFLVNLEKTFLYWLQQAIKQQTLSINQKDSLLHRIPEGLFIQVPETVKVFTNGDMIHDNHSEKQPNADEIQKAIILSIRRPNNLRWLVQNEKTRHYLHEYFRGRWADQDFIEGLILKEAEKVLGGDLALNFSSEIQKNPV